MVDFLNAAYGYCTSNTVLPSERSFLFSLKSDAGSKIVLPIRPDLHNQSFICSDSSRLFPNFGNDLVLDLVSKTVKATYGITYGQNAGRFVSNEISLSASDIEVLVAQGNFNHIPIVICTFLYLLYYGVYSAVSSF